MIEIIKGVQEIAVDMAPVQEIIRVPEVVRVPLAPAALDGLANLRGKVLPILSLRRMSGFVEQEHDDATRAVVVDAGQPLGFVVDRVASVVGVEPGQIEDVGAIRSTVDTDLLSGLIKDVAGHAMIMVLDFEKLIQREFAEIAAIAKTAGMGGTVSGSAGGEEEEASDELQLVSFDVAGQEYAIAIENVQEIVQVPESIIHVPYSASHVLGVMTLRNREDAALRNEAIEAMKQLPDEVAPIMHELLADPVSDVRIFAVNILESLRHPEVEAWLIEVIEKDPHVNVCAAALDLLSEVGTEAALQALPRLKTRFADEPYIHFAADLALKRIRES